MARGVWQERYGEFLPKLRARQVASRPTLCGEGSTVILEVLFINLVEELSWKFEKPMGKRLPNKVVDVEFKVVRKLKKRGGGGI